jgi:hypothetical protein
MDIIDRPLNRSCHIAFLKHSLKNLKTLKTIVHHLSLAIVARAVKYKDIYLTTMSIA